MAINRKSLPFLPKKNGERKGNFYKASCTLHAPPKEAIITIHVPSEKIVRLTELNERDSIDTKHINQIVFRVPNGDIFMIGSDRNTHLEIMSDEELSKYMEHP